MVFGKNSEGGKAKKSFGARGREKCILYGQRKKEEEEGEIYALIVGKNARRRMR